MDNRKIMANTNMLIVGSVFVIGGILTIPFVVGLLCAPFGCFLMFLGIIMSNPTTPPVVVNQQHRAAGGGYVHVGYNQQGQPIYAPANSMPNQHQLRK
jgi:hypothetical protein